MEHQWLRQRNIDAWVTTSISGQELYNFSHRARTYLFDDRTIEIALPSIVCGNICVYALVWGPILSINSIYELLGTDNELLELN